MFEVDNRSAIARNAEKRFTGKQIRRSPHKAGFEVAVSACKRAALSLKNSLVGAGGLRLVETILPASGAVCLVLRAHLILY